MSPLKQRALRWLAQREHSRAELRVKLLRAAATRQPGPDDADASGATAEVDALLAWLDAQGLLSEQRFVESRVRVGQSRFGVERIRHDLKCHGLALDAGTEEQLRASEADRARALWTRRFGVEPADEPARQRQARFMARRGFSAAVIRQLLRETGRTDD